MRESVGVGGSAVSWAVAVAEPTARIRFTRTANRALKFDLPGFGAGQRFMLGDDGQKIRKGAFGGLRKINGALWAKKGRERAS